MRVSQHFVRHWIDAPCDETKTKKRANAADEITRSICYRVRASSAIPVQKCLLRILMSIA